ncbi:hypothetical protein [Methanosarcina sp. Kolksee]|uniref:hypothetical protein n=1 Tax=Methanosarcina sp. Kolksee TaxID=1434099 RepID=UPI0012E07302|nr:hypothetical protein [Methanosarcina sp. Kolksee]
MTENPEPIFGFDELIPRPYRRDQPAQRLRPNGCYKAATLSQGIVIEITYHNSHKISYSLCSQQHLGGSVFLSRRSEQNGQESPKRNLCYK